MKNTYYVQRVATDFNEKNDKFAFEVVPTENSVEVNFVDVDSNTVLATIIPNGDTFGLTIKEPETVLGPDVLKAVSSLIIRMEHAMKRPELKVRTPKVPKVNPKHIQDDVILDPSIEAEDEDVEDFDDDAETVSNEEFVAHLVNS